MSRKYNTISPSARSLLLMKGMTNIPFARQAAELLVHPVKYDPDFDNKNVGFWARIVHFENRYWSIDQLLAEVQTKNILELSSGFSFRGLEMIRQGGFHYIDTDLPEIIAVKKVFVSSLWSEDNDTESKFETLPLDALDEKQFNAIVAHFPAGEIAIVNEGLLMYLDDDEKEKLCRNIHNVLTERGGYWITADIYVKKEKGTVDIPTDERQRDFFEQHNVEENKFGSFEAAKSFFNKVGLTVDGEAQPDPSKLSTLEYLIKSATEEELAQLENRGRIQATWRLKASDI